MKIAILLSGFSLLRIFTCPLVAQTNVFPSSGNVGIGTTTPIQPLEIAKAGNAVVAVHQLDAPASGKYAQITLSQGPTYFGASDKSWQVVSNGLSTGEADLAFQYWNGTSYAERVRITGGGNVGIGTTSPASLLDVYGSLGSTRTAVSTLTHYYNNEANPRWGIGRDYLGSGQAAIAIGAGGSSALDTYIGRDASGALQIQTGGSGNTRLAILPSGNVGIGTTSPAAKLHIHNASSGGLLADGIRVSRPTSDNCYAFTSFGGGSSGEAGDTAFFGSVYAGGTKGRIAFRVSDGTNHLDAATIDPSGNVGIGTTSPSHRLAVNGTIRAKEVIVDTGWSDYVFADDYRLAPLSEVESHIKAERHLPGIPSAREVAEHGVSMGEMQSKLLAKIEELTLHQIAQEKRTAALELQNAELRREIESVKTAALK